jgi:hypothetical protein
MFYIPGGITAGEDNENYDVIFSKGQMVNIDTEGSEWKPSIVAGNDGEIYVAWSSYFNGIYNIHFSKSSDYGKTFSDEVVVTDNNTGYKKNPSIDVDDNGIIYIVWDDTRHNDGENRVYFSKSTDGGKTFGTNIRVTDESSQTSWPVYPKIAVSAQGKIYVVMQDTRDHYHALYFARSTNGGQSFDSNIKINDEERMVSSHTMDIDENENIYVAWMYIGYDKTIYFSRSTDKGQSFSTNERLFDENLNQSNPNLKVSGNGNIYIAYSKDNFKEDWGIYLTKSNDMGNSFTESGMISKNVSGPTGPKIDIYNNDTIHVIWNYYGSSERFLYYSLSVDGGSSFSGERSIGEYKEDGDLKNPVICTSKRGYIYIVYESELWDHSQLYISKSPKPNGPPETVNAIPDTYYLFEDDEKSGENLIDLNEYFKDDSYGDELRYVILYEEDNSVLKTEINNNFLSMQQLLEDWNGQLGFQVRAYDMGLDGEPDTDDDKYCNSNQFKIIVKPTNDPPKIQAIGGNLISDNTIEIVVKQNEYFNASIDIIEVDGEPVSFQTDISDQNFELAVDTGDITYYPTNDDAGKKYFNITVTDKNQTSDFVNIIFVVENINDKPGKPTIVTPIDNEEYSTTDSITFSGTCDDPDLNIPGVDEELRFIWSSDIDGKIGEGSTLENSLLSKGLHEITLEVKDRAGLNNTASIRLNIIKDDDAKGSKNNIFGAKNSVSLVVILIILGIIILVVIFTFFLLKKRRADRLNEGNNTKEEPAQQPITNIQQGFQPQQSSQAQLQPQSPLQIPPQSQPQLPPQSPPKEQDGPSYPPYQ